MPKKKIEKVMETRTMSKRAASKEALRQMQSIISEQAAYDSPEATTLEITSEEEEEVVTVDVAPKRKYRLSHRKSSDGNDRDVLVLKNIGWKEETLKLEAWVEDLSPAQLDMRNKFTNEIDDLNTRLGKLLKETSSEVIYEGDNTALYEFEKELKEKPRNVQSTGSVIQSSKNNNQSGFQLVMDPRSGVVVGTMTPAPQPVLTPAKPQTRKRTRASANLSPAPTPPAKVAKQATPAAPTPPPVVQQRPTEATAVGGLSHGSNQKSSNVVDLTSEDGRGLADSREISFNKLQGKTFPSLVVVARPHLRIKDTAGSDRGKLDSKVKSVLMHAPTKFTEWLIQQGLIRSEQTCTVHPQSKLKLGMYSDVSKFPFSGGYVWISECCPQRFVSVFSGSLFEGSPHPPSVILKLIYHWACQTNVQNVVQWVKVDNLYVKGLNTWLRATCTVALHTHIGPLGGPGKKVEVGVISLGTTSQDGHQRQVKVEVLGLLETEAKLIRLRAVEPLADGDRNYKKRFSKILEPLLQWVHPDSTIVTDLTVDKVTLHSMGFKYVMQTTSTDGVNNHTIMEYLRRIVPRMFQNTLSLLSRQIIQQFLDELVWREWFGTTAAAAFDNIVLHLADQTRVDSGQSSIVRLNKVACNPFKNWSIKHYLSYQTSKSHNNSAAAALTSVTTPATVASETPPPPQKRITKRKVTFKAPSPTPELARPAKPPSPDIPEQMVPLEHYYYGTIEGVQKHEDKIILSLKCNMCKAQFTNNIKLMTHLFTHAHNATSSGIHQCCYCLSTMASKEILDKHIASAHPTDTRGGDNLVCIICEGKFTSTYHLGKHMSKEHVPSELPYQCGTCHFRCSSHKQAVDHFYVSHNGGGMIQCPFCLKSTSVYSNGRNIPQNLSFFLQHLYKHQKKSYPKKCPKCALWFVQKDIIKDHVSKMHTTQRRKAGLVPWAVPRVMIMVPKSRQEEPNEEEEVDISNVIIQVHETLKCRECSNNITSSNHYPALLYCSNNNCQYSTCCRHAMNKHTSECRIFHSTLPVQRLPYKMYCVCGYNDFDGNLMAKHLTVCERKSAYPSEEAAKRATVTHSMLDVLGLVRRPEEPVITNEIMEIDSDDDKVQEVPIKQPAKGRRTKVKDKKVEAPPPDTEPEAIEIVSETIRDDDSVVECTDLDKLDEVDKMDDEHVENGEANAEKPVSNENGNDDVEEDTRMKANDEKEQQEETIDKPSKDEKENDETTEKEKDETTEKISKEKDSKQKPVEDDEKEREQAATEKENDAKEMEQDEQNSTKVAEQNGESDESTLKTTNAAVDEEQSESEREETDPAEENSKVPDDLNSYNSQKSDATAVEAASDEKCSEEVNTIESENSDSRDKAIQDEDTAHNSESDTQNSVDDDKTKSSCEEPMEVDSVAADTADAKEVLSDDTSANKTTTNDDEDDDDDEEDDEEMSQ